MERQAGKNCLFALLPKYSIAKEKTGILTGLLQERILLKNMRNAVFFGGCKQQEELLMGKVSQGHVQMPLVKHQ